MGFNNKFIRPWIPPPPPLFPPLVTLIHTKVRIKGRVIKRVKGKKKRQSPLEAILEDYSISKEKCNPVNIWASPPLAEKRCSQPNGSECLIRGNVRSHYHLTALLMSGSKALTWHQTCSIKLWQLVKSWGSHSKRRWRQCETEAHFFFFSPIFKLHLLKWSSSRWLRKAYHWILPLRGRIIVSVLPTWSLTINIKDSWPNLLWCGRANTA